MIRLKKLPSPAKKRELIMQALYQKEISGCSNTEVIKQFKQSHKAIDLDAFEFVLKAIKINSSEIDQEIEKFSKVKLSEITEIEISILRLAIHELKENLLDKAIVINEAIRLAKKFGQDSSHKFVNAVLDKISS
ncbi:MAG: transcription antitermination factor NusB [Flavobacteriaceae bacterium]|jgi:N utilization substance protein B|nr:transcription antitermination factor NusB [Flavobacteriaceae bacterium]|tara:strand:- start:2882 stop:3283 length:402 start_codon:yes stop_codon:yes gene_type:complete